MIPVRKPPYEGTTVAPEATRGQIEKLLYDYGAEGVQWTTMRDGTGVIRFVVSVEVKGVQRKLGFEVKPPNFVVRKRIGGRIVNMDARAQSMRVLYWYLKSKLEAVAYGVETFEQEFLSKVLLHLPSGETKTVGETASESIARGDMKAMSAGGVIGERDRPSLETGEEP